MTTPATPETGDTLEERANLILKGIFKQGFEAILIPESDGVISPRAILDILRENEELKREVNRLDGLIHEWMPKIAERDSLRVEVESIKAERDGRSMTALERGLDLDNANAELAALRAWKESQMAVMSEIDLQAVGRLIEAPLGSSILPRIQPFIEWARTDITALRARVKELEGVVESAFTEGYDAGYSNGGDDASAFEYGSRKHYSVKERERKQAWQDSEARAALNQERSEPLITKESYEGMGFGSPIPSTLDLPRESERKEGE